MPFGGLQLVAVGDFFQLPPVNGAFCFFAKAWKDLGLLEKEHVVMLTKVVRQKHLAFINVLNSVRSGEVTPETKSMLEQHLVDRKPLPNDDILPTIIYCTNKDVDQENSDHLNALEGDIKRFVARDYEGLSKQQAFLSQRRARQGLVMEKSLRVSSFEIGQKAFILG